MLFRESCLEGPKEGRIFYSESGSLQRPHGIHGSDGVASKAMFFIPRGSHCGEIVLFFFPRDITPRTEGDTSLLVHKN